jgi:hypothetical protein
MGDFRNAALNSACDIASRSSASVRASLFAITSRVANAGSFSAWANFTLEQRQLWDEWRYIHGPADAHGQNVTR